jgi:uroporphyrinogen decarboxylase
MDPYTRALKSINHEKPDRPPTDYKATPEVHRLLQKHFGFKTVSEIEDHFKVDLRWVYPKYIGPADITGSAGVSAEGKDFLGIVWKPVKNKFATYNEIAVSPLAEVKSVQEVEEYNWPSADWFDFSHLKEEIKRINDRERHFVCFFAGGAFETPWYMRGMENYLTDLALQPEIAEAISRKAQEFYKARALKAIEQSDGQIDMIGSGGDIGTQRGMMVSPEIWRKHIKPYSRELIRSFKEMGYYTFYHSCGSIIPVVEDLIEIGLDVLDPVQISADGMDPETLKSQFGDRLSFHGGVDEQTMLPILSPEVLEKKIGELIDVLGSDGGFIPCAAHAIQPDTPIENIIAMYRSILNYRY